MRPRKRRATVMAVNDGVVKSSFYSLVSALPSVTEIFGDFRICVLKMEEVSGVATTE